MTHDDIIRMAREANIHHGFDSEGQWDGLTNEAIIERHPDNEGTKSYRIERLVEILTPFAALVAAAEREAIMDEWWRCVQSDLENGVKSLNEKASEKWHREYPAISSFDTIIRARGQRET